MTSAIAEVMASILLAKRRWHDLTYCEVSEDEWSRICQEHIGGPWFGGMTICHILIRFAQTRDERARGYAGIGRRKFVGRQEREQR
jgi:hypothetical protein